jgi:hypothetical protein
MSKKVGLFLAVVVLLTNTTVAFAGLDDWIEREVIPTITGDRPLEIKPYVRVTHNNKRLFQLGENDLYINIGGVTVQTRQLKQRLLQAGCVIETGNVAACAPDVLERELQNIANSAVRSEQQQPQPSRFTQPQFQQRPNNNFRNQPSYQQVNPGYNPQPMFVPATVCVTSSGTCMITYNLTGGGAGSPCNCYGIPGFAR